jgi:hypothetical protein
MSYRDPFQVFPDGEPPEPGPAKACKACGALAIEARVEVSHEHEKRYDIRKLGRHQESPLPAPRACAPYARVRVGWFSRCDIPGEHLHEHCRVCGLRWLTAFARPS